MKKIMRILPIIILCLNAVSIYGNDDKQLNTKPQYWDAVLYSGDKPADGTISNTVKNKRGADVKVIEIVMDKGIPAGNFKLYNKNKKLIVDGKGKWTQGMFKGKIEIDIPEFDIKGQGDGEFTIDLENLFKFKGDSQDALDIATSLYNGQYKIDGSGKNRFIKECISETERRRYKKLKTEFYSYNGNGELEKKEIYKDGKISEEFIYSGQDKEIEKQESFRVKNGEVIPFTGIYRAYGEDGVVAQEGNYKNGYREGKFYTYNESGKVIKEENYKNGKLDGEFLEYDDLKYDYGSEGSYISQKGQYRDGKKEGRFIIFDYSDMVDRKENYKEGKLDGLFIKFGGTDDTDAFMLLDPLDSSCLYEIGRYKDGKKEGKWKYCIDGIVEKEENYKDGKFDGEVLEYKLTYNEGDYLDGNYLLRKHEYKNGKLNGEYLIYTPVNKEDDTDKRNYLSEKGYYRNGKKTGTFIIYSNPDVVEKIENYKDDILDGNCVYYSKDGTIEREENYKDGKFDGKCRYYRGDGTIELEREYKNGYRVGLEIGYYKNGNKEYELRYSSKSVPIFKVSYNEDGTER